MVLKGADLVWGPSTILQVPLQFPVFQTLFKQSSNQMFHNNQ